eukprot:TRINITY_DN3354_c0_g3_i4.p1 TRINITY_DN3354_c0_g3~~TRINITY_DN3354_c0_g3_i4.p1  ORF type:complete len:445 (+),score=43.29 TRINITY_DN3354_c0_g3_i4:100-1434(+)
MCIRDRLHIYCRECFNKTHKSDSKMSHKTQLLSAVAPGQENLEEALFCFAHSKKYKEYVCLACNQAICFDCFVVGGHVGHKPGSIQKGFEKMAEEFRAKLPECDNLFKLSDTKDGAILKHLKTMLEESHIIKQKIIGSSVSLIKKIKEKTAELVETIDKRISELIANTELIEKSRKDLRSIIDKCKDIISRVKDASHEDYFKLSKNSKELDGVKAILEKWTSVVPEESKDSMPFSLKQTEECEMVIKMLEETFIKGLEKLKTSEGPLLESSIVRNIDDNLLLCNWVSEALKTSKFTFKLLWRGSVDGFEASTFHAKCDGKAPTLTVIQSKLDLVFGGYTAKSWNATNNGYAYDPEAFIFSLTYKTKHNKQKSTSYSIYCNPGSGPKFGGGHDISICDNSNTSNGSCSNGNHTYELPPDIDAKTYFAGARKFKVKDIEVYSVVTH